LRKVGVRAQRALRPIPRIPPKRGADKRNLAANRGGRLKEKTWL
jgi:hypothetical protein